MFATAVICTDTEIWKMVAEGSWTHLWSTIVSLIVYALRQYSTRDSKMKLFKHDKCGINYADDLKDL